MALISRLCMQILSWWQNTPLPADLSIATLISQSWHEFGATSDRWTAVGPAPETRSRSGDATGRDSRQLVLVTWNVDGCSPLPESRLSAIISHILSQVPAVDIIFLQEVSPAALSFLMNDIRIRQHWFSSDADAANWGGQGFGSLTLLSKMRFGYPKESSGRPTLGAVWRVRYPSRFGRDALCCDVFLPISTSPSTAATTAATTAARIRLVNVHLDSLPIQPSQRPEQLSIVASLLRSSCRGLAAGDFNPVLPEDETLVRDNGLVDAWTELHPENPGFTWGIDGKQSFPPNRLDKVALLGLRVRDIELLHPDFVQGPQTHPEAVFAEGSTNPEQEQISYEVVSCSDHSGLRCTFELGGS
ncbi:Uncharacterized protein TPAR_01111 [Tolypocladium paradoxum]|uniref:Endonuclease/exonuclease/phosphatase domain-containing protein n=1 Tax=Tolypocladium paradoxum TaxID=94208 RepID=A0A2S4L8B8_9HYPO|nr:Uncharacterized protein TPAR_01111 [Tolypocladium paradoxum]